MTSRDIYVQTVDEDVQQNEHNTCPECDGRVTTNSRETVCDDCGLVLEDERIDHGPEWREFGGDNSSNRRAGTPDTVARHDRGIGANIGWKCDGYGRQLDSNKQRQLSRLRRRHRRAKIGSKAERNQVAGFTEIRRMVGALGLSEIVRDEACQLFRTAQADELLKGRFIESMASATVYAVCRISEHPRTFDDIAAVSKVSEERVRVAYKALNQHMTLPVPPAGPQQYVSQIASAVDASHKTERQALDRLDAADDQAVANGHNPVGAAAGAIYLAGQRNGEMITQRAVADAAGVATITVRKRYRDLQSESG